MNHEYRSRLVWEGNLGDGTSSYATYGRHYRIVISNKPDVLGSADPHFRGDAALHNPEDLFVASLSSCHLLTYLALCAKNRISVVAYEDDATGTMSLDSNGDGEFESVTLRPRVKIASGDLDLAVRLHDDAHEHCFIARSVSCPVHHEPRVSQV
ncbi:MAG: OsmC family protein [Gemmatimonadota bacterium]|nr:OsmC family protein [Gemmatimonadota bacterium]